MILDTNKVYRYRCGGKNSDGEVFIENVQTLEAWARAGGWATAEAMAKEFDVEVNAFLNNWFTIVHGRLFLKCNPPESIENIEIVYRMGQWEEDYGV